MRPWRLSSVFLIPLAALLTTQMGLAFMAASPTQGEVLSLSLEEAIALALSPLGNTRVGIAREVLEEAGARSDQARAVLLPQLQADISESRQTNNLEALGLRAGATFPIPRLVGPFSTFNARVRLDQVIFSWSAWKRYQAARFANDVASIEVERTKDAVAAATALAYLDAQRTRAWLKAAEANLRLAEELVDLASSQKAAGTGTSIEVTRAEVNRNRESQQTLRARSQYDDALLRLKDWLEVDLAVPLDLRDELQGGPVAAFDPEEAVESALSMRRDYQAQLLREKLQEASLSSARAKHLPELVGFADYGSLGTAPNDSVPTWRAGVGLRIPLFEGGATEAAVAESFARFRQEKLRTRELKDQVALEVRLALSSAKLAAGEFEVAEATVELARRELEQARSRYLAGVTTSLEVTEAQTHLAEANTGRVQALFLLGSAGVQLSDAMGRLRHR